MASPVSFGDAVAMSKIAWRIAHAFTQGRKSAPSEFREVENQLYSLEAALSSFKDLCGSDITNMTFQNSEQSEPEQTALGILDRCRETLRHLEKVVDDYAVITAPKDPSKSRMQRWSAELVKNYKKIAWTTEAGNLATLRSQLMIHTNSLQLVHSTIVSSRTRRIEESMRGNSSMLQEIHSWWAENLKDVTTAKSEPSHANLSVVEQGAPELISFEVYLTADGISELLCPEACVSDDWTETASPQLFACRCMRATGWAGHSRVERITLSPLSYPFRHARSEGSWMLFKTLDQTTGQMVTVTITNVSASDIHEFEEFYIRPLAEARASAMMLQGISNQLVHLSPDAQHVRALNLQSDLKGFHKLIDTVTFRVGHRNLSKANVEGLSLLNYRELGHQSVRPTNSALGHAELSIYYGSRGESADITKSIVHLNHDTVVKVKEGSTSVVIEAVECLGFLQEQQMSRLEKADVAFNMTSLEAAKKLHERFEEMRIELLIASLEYPRPDETVALNLQATEVQCEVAIIPDAELIITRSTQDKYRLIVSSRNRCTVMTQVLPDCFFTSPLSYSPSFASPTWLIRLEGLGKRRVYHYPNGFRFLNFRNTSAERMFELGRTAVMQGAPQTSS